MTGDSFHSARATRALRRLAELDPAFAALALWCRHRDTDTGPDPAWSEARTIHYTPGFAHLPDHEAMGLAAHHILHVAFRHAPRAAALQRRFGPAFDRATFNLAADALVNETLLLAGHALPRPCVTLTGLLREALGETTTAEAALAACDTEALYIRLMHSGPGRSGPSADRSGDADGTSPTERARRYAAANGFTEDIAPDAGAPETAAEARTEAAAWQQHLARALEAGRRAGTGIGTFGWRLADVPRPRTPWERVLRGLLAAAVTDDPRRSDARPTRRWIALDDTARAAGTAAPAFEPATVRSRRVPRIAVGIDCSGSIDDTRLALFATEVAGIGRRTGAEVHVLAFDTEVRSRTRLRGVDWETAITALPFGRDGGTDFRPMLAEAAALDAAILVVLTDLDGPLGPAPRRLPVLWALPGAEPSSPPPFGRVLSLAR